MKKAHTPYLDYIYLMDSLHNYASPKSKLTTMIKSGEVIKLRRGLFLDSSKDYSVKTLANKIYGPSYISFEYALSYYKVIPERAETITCASYGKNKSRRFDTPVGSFLYRNIPRAAYPYGITRIEEGSNPFLIATKEKALCDTLSKIKGVRSMKAIKGILFENLRIDRAELSTLNINDIAFLAPMYRRKILALFVQYLEKEAGRA